MARCEKCKEYSWSGKPCNCKPFQVIDEDGEEYEIYANHEEAAALEFARQYNEDGEYLLMNEEMEITVNKNKYIVSAEPDIHYSSKKL